MMRWSCQRLHGCVATAERPTPTESASPLSCTRRSPSFSAASANVSQRPVRTSTSDAISSPTRCGSTSVPRAAACTSSKRVTSSRDAGSRMANSSSIASVKSCNSSKDLREDSSSSSYQTVCSSPMRRSLARRRFSLDERKLLGEIVHLGEGDGGYGDREPEREEAVNERREKRRGERDSDRVEREGEPRLDAARPAGRQRQRGHDV